MSDQEDKSILQQREELLLNNVPAGVALLDRDLRYLKVSERWCRDYSLDRSKVLGRSHYEVFPDIPDRWKEIHRRGLHGETLYADMDRWDRAGGTAWISWQIHPWKLGDGSVGGILILAEDITRTKQMEEALEKATRKVVEKLEEERTRIARDLHDDVNQRLALVAFQIEELQEAPPRSFAEVRGQLVDIKELLADLSKGIESVSHQLHSPELKYLGLVAAVKQFCREFAARQRVDVVVTTGEVPDSLHEDVSLALFRILQEALHNAAKHSNVRQFQVTLNGAKEHIDLIVSDSGIGFDVQAVINKSGLGLISMSERAGLVNGTISIHSKETEGTTIHVRVPVTPPGKKIPSNRQGPGRRFFDWN